MKNGYLHRQAKDGKWRKRFCEVNGWIVSVFVNGNPKKDNLLALVVLSNATSNINEGR
jgi:hypothetical protein